MREEWQEEDEQMMDEKIANIQPWDDTDEAIKMLERIEDVEDKVNGTEVKEMVTNGLQRLETEMNKLKNKMESDMAQIESNT